MGEDWKAAAIEAKNCLCIVNEWIAGWSPSFVSDDEWPEDRDRIMAAIKRISALASIPVK